MTDTAALVREKLPHGAMRVSIGLGPNAPTEFRAPTHKPPLYDPALHLFSPAQITEKLDGCERCGGDGKIIKGSGSTDLDPPISYTPSPLVPCPECGPLRRLLAPA